MRVFLYIAVLLVFSPMVVFAQGSNLENKPVKLSKEASKELRKGMSAMFAFKFQAHRNSEFIHIFMSDNTGILSYQRTFFNKKIKEKKGLFNRLIKDSFTISEGIRFDSFSEIRRIVRSSHWDKESNKIQPLNGAGGRAIYVFDDFKCSLEENTCTKNMLEIVENIEKMLGSGIFEYEGEKK